MGRGCFSPFKHFLRESEALPLDARLRVGPPLTFSSSSISQSVGSMASAQIR